MNFRQWLLIEEMSDYGEYWITDSGDVMHADGDIGDYNHEAYVIEIVQGNIADHFGIESYHKDWDEVKEEIKEDILSSLEEKEREDILKYFDADTEDDLDADKLIEKELLEDYPNIKDLLHIANGNGDGRFHAISEWGWKRMQGNNIETMTLTPNDAKTIASGIFDAVGDSLYDKKDQYHKIMFNVYVYSSKQTVELSLDDLENGRTRHNPVLTQMKMRRAADKVAFDQLDKPSKFYGRFGD